MLVYLRIIFLFFIFVLFIKCAKDDEYLGTGEATEYYTPGFISINDYIAVIKLFRQYERYKENTILNKYEYQKTTWAHTELQIYSSDNCSLINSITIYEGEGDDESYSFEITSATDSIILLTPFSIVNYYTGECIKGQLDDSWPIKKPVSIISHNTVFYCMDTTTKLFRHYLSSNEKKTVNLSEHGFLSPYLAKRLNSNNDFILVFDLLSDNLAYIQKDTLAINMISGTNLIKDYSNSIKMGQYGDNSLWIKFPQRIVLCDINLDTIVNIRDLEMGYFYSISYNSEMIIYKSFYRGSIKLLKLSSGIDTNLFIDEIINN